MIAVVQSALRALRPLRWRTFLALQAAGQCAILVESTEGDLFGAWFGHPSLHYAAMALNVLLLLRVVATDEIDYLQATNKYTTVNTRSGSFLLTSSLKEMQQKLDPAVFLQIHRSTIVKLKERKELLPVSGSHAHLFRQS